MESPSAKRYLVFANAYSPQFQDQAFVYVFDTQSNKVSTGVHAARTELRGVGRCAMPEHQASRCRRVRFELSCPPARAARAHYNFGSARLPKVVSKVSVGPRPVHLYAIPELQTIWTHSDGQGTFDVIAMDDVSKLSATSIKVGSQHGIYPARSAPACSQPASNAARKDPLSYNSM
jgi:hypothetical protein